MKSVFIMACALVLIACDRQGSDAGTPTDTTSRFERGMERVGKQIESAAEGVGSELSETRVQMILDNIRGMDSVQAEITSDGSVVLIGTVSTEAARTEAERLVRSIEGVNNVRNAIEVGVGSGATESTDTTATDSALRSR